ncbi:hypothetical protein BDZ91DRAFT_288779 [Kalaharituber pfeilii]|nr:hypothetical protein BDZ91DRAFT_288779 [Kalaharituber pfeilii]
MAMRTEISFGPVLLFYFCLFLCFCSFVGYLVQLVQVKSIYLSCSIGDMMKELYVLQFVFLLSNVLLSFTHALILIHYLLSSRF